MHEYILNPGYAPGNGAPQYITSNNAFLATATKGGLISYGPLTGIAFGQGGTPYQFNYGTHVAGDVFMAGGDARSTLTSDAYSLLPDQNRRTCSGACPSTSPTTSTCTCSCRMRPTGPPALLSPQYQVATGPTAAFSSNPATRSFQPRYRRR